MVGNRIGSIASMNTCMALFSIGVVLAYRFDPFVLIMPLPEVVTPKTYQTASLALLIHSKHIAQ